MSPKLKQEINLLIRGDEDWPGFGFSDVLIAIYKVATECEKDFKNEQDLAGETECGKLKSLIYAAQQYAYNIGM